MTKNKTVPNEKNEKNSSMHDKQVHRPHEANLFTFHVYNAMHKLSYYNSRYNIIHHLPYKIITILQNTFKKNLQIKLYWRESPTHLS